MPRAIPNGHAVFPADPTVHRFDVFAWNATSNPPPDNPEIDGLVPGNIPNGHAVFPADPTVHTFDEFA